MPLVLSACSSVGAAITARAEMIIPVKISTAPDVSYISNMLKFSPNVNLVINQFYYLITDNVADIKDTG